MTTNLGARRHGEVARLGFAAGGTASEYDNMRQRVEDELRRAFRPEFLNRVDDIIVFNQLSEGDLEKIASLMLSSVADRIENTGVLIEFDDSVSSAVVAQSGNREYGARPLRRTIKNLVEIPYSIAILEGKFKKGDFIRGYAEDGRVIFEKKSV